MSRLYTTNPELVAAVERMRVVHAQHLQTVVSKEVVNILAQLVHEAHAKTQNPVDVSSLPSVGRQMLEDMCKDLPATVFTFHAHGCPATRDCTCHETLWTIKFKD